MIYNVCLWKHIKETQSETDEIVLKWIVVKRVKIQLGQQQKLANNKWKSISEFWDFLFAFECNTNLSIDIRQETRNFNCLMSTRKLTQFSLLFMLYGIKFHNVAFTSCAPTLSRNEEKKKHRISMIRDGLEKKILWCMMY